MNKTILMLVGILSAVSSGALFATSEIRSPLGRFGDVWFDYRYPLEPVNDDGWQVDVQKVGYERCSAKMFGLDPKCIVSCDDADKVTNKTQPLSALFFNKSDFKGQEAFFGGNLNGRASNAPGLVFSTLSPRISYEEHGISLGVHAYKELGAERNWRMGGRIGLPIKVIKVEEDRSCGFERPGNGSEASSCIIDCRQEITAENISNTVDVCAYRLDFLSTLKLPNGLPMVEYGDGVSPTKIAGYTADTSIFNLNPPPAGFDQDCTQGNLSSGPNAPVYLMRQSTGSMPYNPINPFLLNTQTPQEDNFILVNACATDLPKDGNVGADNDRYRFLTTNDYTSGIGSNTEEQAKWFVIPVAGEGISAFNSITREMFNVIAYVVQKLDVENTLSVGGATQFFFDHGIDLCPSKRVVGAGDLETQIYGGHYWDRGYVNGFTGFRFPTGKEHDDQKCVYFQPTGHNGHFEMMFGLDGGWHPNTWFAFNIDASYHHVFEHTERRAAPFTGATIRNIGPAVDVDVKWGWVQINAFGTFYHPKDANLGCTFGYEFYAKRKDSVCLCRKTATDFLGSDYSLDQKLLAENTNSQTHKIRGTGFYRIGYAEFMFGASYILAGKHAMREAEWHLGMNVSF